MQGSVEELIGNGIYEISNPSRYFPSEYHLGKKRMADGDLKCAICFPDLYEIGMSNNAVRILYDLINRQDGAFCDRVFSVAPDFEAVLREKNIPLFTLDMQLPVKSLDLLGMAVSSELSGTDILQVLDLSGIPFDHCLRTEDDPIVIAGGPAVTNPAPFGRFFDFIHIGEAEADFPKIVSIMRCCTTRAERMERLKEIPYLWYEGKDLAIRAVDNSFGTCSENSLMEYAVVPAFQVAQDHGTAEIMRGCPNGCRFCHAGQYYKPFRQRSMETVFDIVRQNVDGLGYRDITLSSLSSGDYPSLDKMIDVLNANYRSRAVSFSLPSLKVSSFSLGILEQLSEVRKSGLTFAIETPDILDQRSMNKEVFVQRIIEIITEARSRGWKLAKFYFMVGLPFVDRATEKDGIVSFLSQIRTATKINMNINIGTFIPKPHTPFERAAQMSLEDSGNHLRDIKRALQAAIPGIKVTYHEPSISFLEGVVSRGDASVADIIERAYAKGCRLDAWDEYIDFSKWQEVLSEAGYDTSRHGFSGFGEDEVLPWDSVSLNVSKSYFKSELSRAGERILTSPCSPECDHRCGVCGRNASVRPVENTFDDVSRFVNPRVQPEDYRQVILTYSKSGRALFCSHIATMRHFEMAFQRAGIDVKFTEGFNPKPRLEFANPITMGVIGENELLLCEIPDSQIGDDLVDRLNEKLATGYVVKSYQRVRVFGSGKKISLASHLLGSDYVISDIRDSAIAAALEKACNTACDDFEVTSDGCGSYDIHIRGEKNIFKLLFPADMSKFHVTGSCRMVRTNLVLEEI